MKVALVYDRVNKIGGAERVLTALHAIWPDAPLYTSVYYPNGAPWAHEFDVRTTFLQRIPFAKRHHEWFAWLTPFAFADFSFDEFDVVISITSAEAKGIITKPGTLHICYCLTPTRYLWSGKDEYVNNTGFGIFHQLIRAVFLFLLPTLQSWDWIAAQRPDRYAAISKRVARRITEFYKRTVDAVIYPPVDTDFFHPDKGDTQSGEYYLVVSRLVPYKRLDIIVESCTKLGRNLIVIGSGSELAHLRSIAGKTVQFVTGNLTDEAVVGYYQGCRAFVYAGDEDFGIVAGEAQSCGKPVIAYRQSGIAEIVKDGVTGVLYDQQSANALCHAILRFESMHVSPEACRKRAEQFGKRVFQKTIQTFVERSHLNYYSTL